MHRTRWMLVVCLLVAAPTVAACGGGNDKSSSSGSQATATATETATPTETATRDGGGGGAETLKLAAPADGSLKFDKTTLTAKAGKVTIDFDNPASVPHAVNVEGNGIQEKGTDTITKSKTSVTVDLKPGTYEFYCPVDGHRAAGMEGKLTVS
jgi:plastocyanin